MLVSFAVFICEVGVLPVRLWCNFSIFLLLLCCNFQVGKFLSYNSTVVEIGDVILVAA